MADFHFIRPYCLLALLLLPMIIWLIKRLQVSSSGWQKILPPHLAKVLINQGQQGTSNNLFIPGLITILAILALAGPSWQKLPQPVYQVARGSVLVMDMSYSMLATDISPNRLTRARYKATDLLDNINEGEMGLIAYAGDAFTISPLTTDINNIKLLLPSLSPDIMPELGSNPYAALTLAEQMLKNAGHVKGDIFWFTDGVDNEELTDLHQLAQKSKHNINILGVGSKAGAPIKLSNGELMKDDSGTIVVPKLTAAKLKGIAQSGHGRYHSISLDNSDIDYLLTEPVMSTNEEQQAEQRQTGDQWQEAGPYLLLVILPLLLSYFRRGQLLALLPLSLLLIAAPSPSYASVWQDLWHTKDQQAQQEFDQQAYADAAKKFANQQWQASAHYKAGDYEQALKGFQQADNAEALYNQGNALAKLNRFDEAIKTYQQALEKKPGFAAAKANKELLEKLKQQQKNQENQQEQEQQSQSQDKQQQEQQGQNSSDNQKSSSEQQSTEQNSDSQQQDSQNQPSDSESKQDSESADNNQQNANSTQQNQELAPPPENSHTEQQEQQAQAAEPRNEQQAEQAAAINSAELAESQDQETQQKHQQLLKKVTDDPYLLLRNKMQLEYQKRRHNRMGVKKKW